MKNSMRCDVFVAVSYRPACFLDPNSESTGYRQSLEFLTTRFEQFGLCVYLAPREERWGTRRPSRSHGISRDFRALRQSSVFIIFLDGNESDGGLVELGVALGLEKAIWIVRRRSEVLPSYVRGLVDLEKARVTEFDNKQDLSYFVDEVVTKHAPLNRVIGQGTSPIFQLKGK